MPERFLWLHVLQLLSVLCTVALDHLVTGAVGLLLPFGSLVVVTFLSYLWIASRREGWPRRRSILGLANRSGVVLGVIAASAYGIAFALHPDSFDFPSVHLFWIIPMLGAACWLAVSILCVCVGDTVATIHGTHPRKGGSFRDYPWDDQD